MLIILSIFLAFLLILVIALFLLSPGKPRPILDENGSLLAGSIAEKIHVTINGADQGMFIKSRDGKNPVLLFLHGGPGMPEYYLTRRYPTGLEDIFTVCWWEQRGSGLSFHTSIPPETMTVEQFISDTLGVANYLRTRFGKEKIYLMAHSWGSFIGIQAAARAPELFHAYIGISQISYQIRSENIAYAYMLEQYKTNGNTNMVRRLEGAPPSMTVPLPAAYDALRDEAMHTLGIGTTRDMKSVVTGIFVPSWLSKEYTLAEKAALWRGKIFSKRKLWNTALATDLTGQVTGLNLPTYFFSGKHDYTVCYSESKSYYDSLKAPLKGFYTFEQSAHSPMFEEPERIRRIMREDVLAGENNLAD